MENGSRAELMPRHRFALWLSSVCEVSISGKVSGSRRSARSATSDRDDGEVVVLSPTADDADLVGAINRCTGAGLSVRGRSESGKAGGAIFVEWPDGRLAVVTVFHGGLSDAERVAGVLNHLQSRGFPVPRHELVADLGDRVAFVQQRLRKGSPRTFSPRRVDGIVEINERFAGAMADFPDVPPVASWFQQGEGDSQRITDLTPEGDRRASGAVSEIIRLTSSASSAEHLAGTDLVHVEISARRMCSLMMTTPPLRWLIGTLVSIAVTVGLLLYRPASIGSGSFGALMPTRTKWRQLATWTRF